jgi:hypothetical protein
LLSKSVKNSLGVWESGENKGKNNGDRSSRSGCASTPAFGRAVCAFGAAFNVQAEAWTYPRSNGNGNGNGKSKGKATATAKAKAKAKAKATEDPPPAAKAKAKATEDPPPAAKDDN